jgi:FkbM family methyltransferase
VAGSRPSCWSSAVARAARGYLELYDNLSYDPERNGEYALIRRLGLRPADVVVDVGANRGDWTAAVVAAQPDAEVHAVEIEPRTASSLQRRYSQHPTVTVHATGLGAHTGIMRLRSAGEGDRRASLLDDPLLVGHKGTVDVPVTTGDRLLDDAGVGDVVLGKIDTEGATLSVLDGLVDSLASGRIGVLQMEWNEWSLAAGATIREHHRRLEPHGYELGRLLPHGVALRPYDWRLEREAPGNLVAIHRSRADLVRRAVGRAGGRAR